MSIDCDGRDVSLAGTGKLQLRSFWTSDHAEGEFARFEVRLPAKGAFRFVADGAQITVVKGARRKIKAGTAVEISMDYINLLPGPNKRLARLVLCGITEDGVEVKTTIPKYLP